MAEIKIGNVTYGASELSKTFQTYRKDFILMPFLAMAALAKHCNVRTGIRYRETVSQMSASAEIGNYSKTKHEDAAVNIDPRVFETFFGNIVQGIDPNAIYQSIWGSNITKGDGLKNVPIVNQVCAYLVKKIGENMFMNAFTAKHEVPTPRRLQSGSTASRLSSMLTLQVPTNLLRFSSLKLLATSLREQSQSPRRMLRKSSRTSTGQRQAMLQLQLSFAHSSSNSLWPTRPIICIPKHIRSTMVRCHTIRATISALLKEQAMSSLFHWQTCLRTSSSSHLRITSISSLTSRQKMRSSWLSHRSPTTTTLTSL